MKNSITKQSRGITLIALIITIVVLLILAVVAIGAAQESNIVGYAQNAATKYEQAQDNEIGLLAQYEAKIESVLAKDRIYRLQGGDAYIKITKDNKVEFGSVDGNVEGPINFEYVAVTENVLTIVKNYGGTIPNNISDYSSRALKIKTGEDEYYYLLLSKDEKTLYYSGYALILDGASSSQPEPETSEWTAYGTQSQYYLVGTSKAYLVYEGNINMELDFRQDKSLKEYYNEEQYDIDSNIKDISKVLVYNDTNPIAVINSNNQVCSWSIDNGDGTKIVLTLNKTNNKNNQIDYSSVLDKIQ